MKRNDRDWTSGVVSRSFTGRTARWKSRRWPCSPSALRSARRVCSSCPTRRACSRANIGSTSPSSPWIKGNNQKSNPDPNCSKGSIDCQESPGQFSLSLSPFDSIKCTELENYGWRFIDVNIYTCVWLCGAYAYSRGTRGSGERRSAYTMSPNVRGSNTTLLAGPHRFCSPLCLFDFCGVCVPYVFEIGIIHE